MYLDTSNSFSYPTTGTSWIDLSGNNHTAQLNTGVTYDSRILGNLTFDNVSSSIDLSLTTASKSGFTISSWIYIDDFTTGKTNQGRVFLRNTGNSGSNLISLFDGGYSFETNTNSDPHEISSATSGSVLDNNINTGSWFNFSMVFSSSNFYGYVNGNLNGSGSISDDLIINNIGSGIGYSDLYPAEFKGNISDLVFYNKSLTSDEISQNYNFKKNKYRYYITDSINYFISTWDTNYTYAGSTNSTQIKLPLVSGGTYDMIVDWGDGTSSTITQYNVGNTHTYDNAGTYTVKIQGTCRGWAFNDGGDRQKITFVSQWGILELIGGYGFYGCSNLDSNASDAPVIIGTDFRTMFRNCISLTGGVSNWDVSGCTLFSDSFRQCSVFNGDITGWNVSSATNMTYMFSLCTIFNQDISVWNVSNVTRMDAMFSSANVFNQNLGSLDLSGLVTDVGYGSMTNMFFGGSGVNTTNYDAMLIAWEAQGVSGVRFNAGTSQYTSGGAAEAARTSLINTYNWDLTDSGGI